MGVGMLKGGGGQGDAGQSSEDVMLPHHACSPVSVVVPCILLRFISVFGGRGVHAQDRAFATAAQGKHMIVNTTNTERGKGAREGELY